MAVEKNPIQVTHFVECWLPQTEIWLYNHVKALPPWVESRVVCQWTANLDQFPNENLTSLQKPPIEPTLFQRICRRLRWWDDLERHLPLLEQIIREAKTTLLHSHFGHCGSVNAKLARKYCLPHVVSFYGLDVGYLPTGDHRWVEKYRRLSDQVDLVLCEGPHMAQCVANLGIDAKKIRVFRLGIDLNRLPFVPREKPSEGVLRFLIAGSFREKKGIPYALEALGQFSKTYPEIEITVIGDSAGSRREEEQKRRILEEVDRWHLGTKIRFLGYQPHDVLVREYYRNHLFISPSVTSADGDTEGGAPVTIIEAAASGMPVISSLHCDIPFVLSKENQTYLARERDSAGLARAIQGLLDLKYWEPIVAANRRLIEAELDLQKQGQKLGEIYAAVIGETQSPRECIHQKR